MIFNLFEWVTLPLYGISQEDHYQDFRYKFEHFAILLEKPKISQLFIRIKTRKPFLTDTTDCRYGENRAKDAPGNYLQQTKFTATNIIIIKHLNNSHLHRQYTAEALHTA